MTQPLTDEELTELRAVIDEPMVERLERLEREATPGPWQLGNPWEVAGVMASMFGEGKCCHCAHSEPLWVGKRDINGARMTAHVHRGEPWKPDHEITVDDPARPGTIAGNYDYEAGGIVGAADAALIVAMRNDLPSLLSQLGEQRERANTAHQTLRDNAHAVIAQRNRAVAAERTVREQREAKDHAYWERNQLVRVLSVMYPSYIALSDDPDWPIVYVELPTGQASWHIPATEIPTFNHLEWEPAAWDGHTDAEKYARLAALAPDTEPSVWVGRSGEDTDDNWAWQCDECGWLGKGLWSERAARAEAKRHVCIVAPDTEGEGT